MKELKIEYNKIITRINNAEKFFKTCTNEEFEKYLPLMIQLCNKAAKLLIEIKKLGYKANIDEIERGFIVEN